MVCSEQINLKDAEGCVGQLSEKDSEQIYEEGIVHGMHRIMV